MRLSELANTCLGSGLECFEIFGNEGLLSVSAQYVAATSCFSRDTKSSGEEAKESWVLPESLSPWNCAVDSSLSRMGVWELKG